MEEKMGGVLQNRRERESSRKRRENAADTGQESEGQQVSAKRPCRRRIEELSY